MRTTMKGPGFAGIAMILAVLALPGAAMAQNLTGAGATFQYPLQSKWSSEYGKAHPEVRVNYQSIGSGGGIRQITARTVQFGATDGPMTDAQLAEAKDPILHVPVTLGAVAVAVNLPEVTRTLDLTGPVVADIFLGKITNWSDRAIAATNPGVVLPDRAIAVAHRSDGSGTTFIFVDYLAKVSTEWKDKVGVATSVNWPVGLGAKGNEGVAGTIKQTPGAIGYVELTYALQNGIPTARIKNPAGEFVAPSVDAVTKAAAGAAANLPDDLRVSITNAPGAGAYPISGFSWVLVYRAQQECDVASALLKYLWWGVHEGQAFSAPLHYAPLPAGVVSRCEAKLKSVTCNGAPVL